MKQYLDLLRHVLDNGTDKGDRTGTGTRSVFGYQMRFDLADGFPLATTKKIHLKSVIHELLWMLNGDTNVKYLNENGVTIWDEWADENGCLGPVYGAQWRRWWGPGDSRGIHSKRVDQIRELIYSLRTNPESRRHLVTAWNPAELEHMALAPCHCLFQFDAAPLGLQSRYEAHLAAGGRLLKHLTHGTLDQEKAPEYRLSCQLYQRSADLFLGVPFNIASYALLTHMVAQQVNMIPGDFIWTGGDCHIYSNHFGQVHEQLSREPLPLPTLELNKAPSIFDYKYGNFSVHNYESHPAIKAPVAV